MYKLLITCPPMLNQLARYEPELEKEFSITAPKLIQQMSIDELIELVPEHDYWIIGDDPVTKEVLYAGKQGKLKGAVKWGIGVDNIDFSAAKELKLPIQNTPGVFGNEVADMALSYLLALARHTVLFDRNIRLGHWPKESGSSLTDKTLGIVGLGDIGRNIKKRAEAFGLNLIGWDPFLKETVSNITLDNWPNRLDECDYLVFACALTESNTHMLNFETLKYLKKGVSIINISRGPLIEEKALIEGLKKGVVKSVALDVYEEEPISASSELFNFSQNIFGSHNGSNTIEGVDRASLKAISIIKSFI